MYLFLLYFSKSLIRAIGVSYQGLSHVGLKKLYACVHVPYYIYIYIYMLDGAYLRRPIHYK